MKEACQVTDKSKNGELEKRQPDVEIKTDGAER